MQWELFQCGQKCSDTMSCCCVINNVVVVDTSCVHMIHILQCSTLLLWRMDPFSVQHIPLFPCLDFVHSTELNLFAISAMKLLVGCQVGRLAWRILQQQQYTKGFHSVLIPRYCFFFKNRDRGFDLVDFFLICYYLLECPKGMCWTQAPNSLVVAVEMQGPESYILINECRRCEKLADILNFENWAKITSELRQMKGFLNEIYLYYGKRESPCIEIICS